ncbi:MAG: Do family serine endopeptidase [Phycisphaerae bacterium]|nr:Do family serine endopeptidase [Phycisphaerae bacterium]
MMRNVWKFLPLVGVVLVVVLAIVFGEVVVERISYAANKGANAADREALVELSERDQLSGLFRAVAKTVKPAVVEMRVKKRVSVPQMPDFFDSGFPSRRRRQPQQPRYFLQRGLGSGVIVDADKGYILTNHHVVGGADEVEIILADGRKIKAEWVRSDPQTDLAVVKIKADGLIAAPLGDSDKMQVGDWVLAIGSPEGLHQTVTAGIISAKGRVTGRGGYENFLQTDAAINHGNSGGPLVNMRGEVIGINAAIVSRTGVNEGLGLAIPSNMAANVMKQLIKSGKVVRGFLGVTIQDVDEKLAGSFKLPSPDGALVTRVAKDSPAGQAGIKEEDFIVAIDADPVKNVNDLRNRVAGLTPGSEAKFTLYRDGKKKIVAVKIAAQPADMHAALGVGKEKKAAPEQYGLKVRTLTEALASRGGYDKGAKGVLVVAVTPGSDAAERGLRKGMVIDSAGGREITTADEFASAVSAGGGKPLRLRVNIPDGGRHYVIISPK